MDIKNRLRSFLGGKKEDLKSLYIQEGYDPEASYGRKPYMPEWEIYDGEKTFGELGRPINYQADFRSLAIRSWQSFYESDITQIIVSNYLSWAIGDGLMLECEPVSRLIKRFDPNFDRDQFVDDVEMLWKLYSEDKIVSHNKMQDLHQLAWEAEMNAIIGGDCLVIMRFENNYPTIQLIDGLHVSTPMSGTWIADAKKRENKIKNGVEINSKGTHIAYYVHKGEMKYERVLATHIKTKRPAAWLVYGKKYRTNDVRGMPLFAVVVESLKKLDRYKDASISSAEERAKIVYSIQHSKDSTGENPLNAAVRASVSTGQGNKEETEKYPGDQEATKLAMTTGNTAINLPVGSELKALKSDSEGQFTDFFTPNFDLICASFEIPPEVALAKYNSNYSASRMAVKTWEHKVKISRNKFTKQFYKPTYDFWLDMEILKGMVIANGYITARISNQWVILKAFKNSSFDGVNMPQVDPVKEVKAELMKLGESTLPISTREKVSKALGAGDWRNNVDRFKEENDHAKELLKKEEDENKD